MVCHYTERDSLPGWQIVKPAIEKREGRFRNEIGDELVRLIDEKEWQKELSRSVQHYGFDIAYGSNIIQGPSKELPDFYFKLCDLLSLEPLHD